jgi:diaminohydroxyphosphoribosylaminopyrimidine deaminase/5-amino-6-(5-phosphoribosylamino)uracil reductase
LKRNGLNVIHGIMAEGCAELNEAFNHWIIHRTPFVTVKAAMTMDGKIATAARESKWITGEKARAHAMRLRRGADAILVGINTILADNPKLTVRGSQAVTANRQPRRIVLDSMARTPLTANVISDEYAARTTIVVSRAAPEDRVAALSKHVALLVAPVARTKTTGKALRTRSLGTAALIDLGWLLNHLGSEKVTSLLVEGGAQVNASFLLHGLAQRVAFFYAPKVFGGRDALPAVGGLGVRDMQEAIRLSEVQWSKHGQDLMMTARVKSGA